MRNKSVQMSLFDIYNGVSHSMEEHKPELIQLLEEHLDFDSLIPTDFRLAFYRRHGRKHIYHLESFIRALTLQKLLGISTDKLLITILKTGSELRDFCGFDKVPDASQFSRFRENYCDQLKVMFERMVDLTEPICREIDAKKADYLIYDTTGIELPVSENNPKFMSAKLQQAKTIANTNLILKCIQSSKYFSFLATLNGGRCSWATLTGVKLSQNGKDVAATIDFRLRLVLRQSQLRSLSRRLFSPAGYLQIESGRKAAAYQRSLLLCHEARHPYQWTRHPAPHRILR